MYLIIAPIVTISIVLTLPGISMFFERGAFTHHDSQKVALLLSIYLLSSIPAVLGSVTGKSLYSLRLTRIVSVLGTIESVAFIIYTFFLVKTIGIIGIPVGYLIYFSVSFLWAIVLIRNKIGKTGLIAILLNALKITVASILASLPSVLACEMFSADILRILFGGSFGILVFIFSCQLLGISEFSAIKVVVLEKYQSIRSLSNKQH